MSATAFCSRSESVGGREVDFFLPAAAAGWEGLVTLLECGPKARVCWARAVVFEGLRRLGGMLCSGDGCLGVVETVLAVVYVWKGVQ